MISILSSDLILTSSPVIPTPAVSFYSLYTSFSYAISHHITLFYLFLPHQTYLHLVVDLFRLLFFFLFIIDDGMYVNVNVNVDVNVIYQGMAFYVGKDLGQGTVTAKDYDLYCHFGTYVTFLRF